MISFLSACGGDGDDGIDTSTDFTFDASPESAYTQIDRHGAVEAGTVAIAGASGLGIAPIRDVYNAANPVIDAQGTFVGVITQSVNFFHAALDDDLRGAGLIPATTAVSLAQAAPVVVPDVIRFDPTKTNRYPNGRKLTDPVVDITVAAILLDLSQGGQTVETLADIPLNPPANDKSFKSSFPFLADPTLP